MMQIETNGVVRGKTIELSEAPGFAEGQPVSVVIKPLPAKLEPGEGWKRLAGILADDWTDEDDRILEEIYQSRKLDRGLPDE